MFKKYLKELYDEWTAKAFFLVDILLFVVSSVSSAVTIPVQFYWIVGIVGFIIANFSIYTKNQDRVLELQNKIDEYEFQEANIKLKVLTTKTVVRSPISMVSERLKTGLSEDGLDDYFVPLYCAIHARLEIENAGFEQGALIWRLDLEDSDLPNIFFIAEKSKNGYIEESHGKEPGMMIKARSSEEKWWKLQLLINPTDAKSLARRLSKPEEFRISLRYRTKRIGGESDEKTLMIEGDLSPIRDSLVTKWNNKGQWGLVNTATGKDVPII